MIAVQMEALFYQLKVQLNDNNFYIFFELTIIHAESPTQLLGRNSIYISVSSVIALLIMLCSVMLVITSYCLLKRRQQNMPMSGRLTLETADSQRYFNYEGK